MKKITAIIISLVLIAAMAVNTAAVENYEDTANFLISQNSNPGVSAIGGEWLIIGLARSEAHIPDGYFETYYNNVATYIKAKNGVLHSRKYTEYSRVILALTAIGKDPENVDGYNLVLPILDFDKTVWQGINGSIWALLALDSADYGSSEIRDKYISHILSKEKKNGGWALSDSTEQADPDITAMALTALAKYRDRQDVCEAAERGIRILSEMQNQNGGYSSYDTEASESTAQVLTAISALGISHTDERFVKNGKTLLDNIYSFKRQDGSFSHTDKQNLMATEQCYYSLVALKRFEDNKNALFDMTDIKVLERKPTYVNVPNVKYKDKSFKDIVGHKKQLAVESLAKRGIINGVSDNIFAPDSTMTRAEFATITVRALGLPISNKAVFTDVKSESWYYGYVNTAYSYGIVNGISENEFDPNGTITVQQACVMTARAARLCGTNTDVDGTSDILAKFSDGENVSEWAASSVAFCAESGIIEKNSEKINPGDAVTRSLVADMLYNMLKGANLI